MGTAENTTDRRVTSPESEGKSPDSIDGAESRNVGSDDGAMGGRGAEGSVGRKVRRVATWSFWLIMAAHVAAFTAIGLFTERGWKLLLVFLCALAATMALKALITRRLKKRRPPNRR